MKEEYRLPLCIVKTHFRANRPVIAAKLRRSATRSACAQPSASDLRAMIPMLRTSIGISTCKWMVSLALPHSQSKRLVVVAFILPQVPKKKCLTQSDKETTVKRSRESLEGVVLHNANIPSLLLQIGLVIDGIRLTAARSCAFRI